MIEFLMFILMVFFMDDKVKQIELFEEESIIIFEPSKMLNVPSSAIHIENDISLVQKKLWFELVYHAFPKMGSQRTYSIPLQRLRELLGWKETTSNDTELKEALHGLNQTAIKWNIFGKDKKRKWQSFPLLAGCEIPENSGMCIFELSSFLEERFLSMGEEAYLKIDLIISRKFQSKYSLSIYCLALDYLMLELGYSEKKFSIPELRRYLALKEGEYKLTADMNRWIIKPSEEEINKTSDMNIQIVPFKEGRKIVGYKLCMSLKQGRAKEYLDRRNKLKEITQKSVDKLIDLPKKHSKSVVEIKDESIRSFFAKNNISYTTDMFQSKLSEIENLLGTDTFEKYILFLIQYAENEYQKGEIKNLSGFFVSLIKDDSQIDNYFYFLEKEKEKELKKQKIVESKINEKLMEDYLYFIKTDFLEYITDNVDSLEDLLIYNIENNIDKNHFVYKVLILKRNNGIVDKNIIKNRPYHEKSNIISKIEESNPNFKKEMGYKELSYEEWKNKVVTSEYIDKVRHDLKNLL